MESRILKLQEGLTQPGEAALVLSDVNRFYLSGFASSAGAVFITRKAACLLVDFRYGEAAQRRVKDLDVVVFDNLSQQLCTLAKKYSVKKVFLESATISVKQANTLKKESRDIRKISMMLAIADIPFGIFSFQGFLCVLQLGTRQYKFTTYNHSKLTSYREKQNEVTILEFDKGNYHLIVRLKPGKKNQLKAPLGGKMRTNVEESLDGTMSVTLKKGSKVLVKQQLVACAIEKYTNKNSFV